MHKLRRLLHIVPLWLLAMWLGMGAAVHAGSLPDCCQGPDDMAPCCLLAAGGCAPSVPCPPALVPPASLEAHAPLPCRPRLRPVSDAVVLPVQIDEIWRPPDGDGWPPFPKSFLTSSIHS